MLPALRPTYEPVNRIGTLFDRFFGNDFFSDFLPTPAFTASTLPLEMWQDEENVYVEAEVPGLAKEDVEVAVHNGMLHIRGERKAEERKNRFSTRSYGRFEQAVTLPAAVDASKVEAKLTNGVLQVCLPKSPEARPTRIAIKSE
jgi:HSP20 family protein